MPVLTRRIGESLIIGDNIVLKILRVNGDQLHLGIETPQKPNTRNNKTVESDVAVASEVMEYIATSIKSR